MMRERQDTVALPPLYARWQELLAVAFFQDADGRPVVFFTDDEELDRLWSQGGGDGDAAVALAEAVGQLVDVRRGPNMFDRLLLLERIWRQEARAVPPPPTLPLLAMSVLAASRMGSDSEGAAHNYYVRLVQALLPAASATARDQARRAIREGGAFVAVAHMWQCLDTWLEVLDGEAGLSTIREDPELAWRLLNAILDKAGGSHLVQLADPRVGRSRLNQGKKPGRG